MQCLPLVVVVLVVLLASGQVEGVRRHQRGSRGGFRRGRGESAPSASSNRWYQEGRVGRTVLHQPFIQTRPVVNSSVPVKIGHGLNLIAITDMSPSMHHPIVTFRAQVRQVWTDPRLTWDPTDAGNIRRIHIRSDEIWTPETEISPSLDDVDYLSRDKYEVIATSSGAVTWTYDATYRVPCSILPDQNPVTCSFRAWTPNYEANEIKIVPISDTVNIVDCVTTGLGDVTDSSVAQELLSRTPAVYSTLHYEFTFGT